LNIFGFKPGEYDLTITVNDASPVKSVSAKRKFWIYKDHRTLSMSEEDIKRYRDQIKYFASNAELEVFDSLGPEGLEEYLVNFWRRRDTSPETPENEFMIDVFAKIDYANKNFKGTGSGLNSDMGRVFVIYGQPDEIEDFSMNMDGKPYIIWHYYSSGSGKHYFAFVDKSADGVYRLVHSSVETEIKDEMWRQSEL
jgi:GWxTD domain-containing protein